MKLVDGKEFIDLIQNTDQPIVVDMYADWCMPCKAAAPHFEALANKYESNGAIFLKINVDQEPNIAQALGVMGVPSFFILKGKTIISKIVGVNLQKLETDLIKELGIKSKEDEFFTAYI